MDRKFMDLAIIQAKKAIGNILKLANLSTSSEEVITWDVEVED